MPIVVTFISTLVHFYSTEYMSLHFPRPFKAELNVNKIGDIMATCIQTHQKTMYDVTIVHNEIAGDLQKHKKFGLL